MPHPIRRTAALTLLCAGLLVPAATSHAGPAKGVVRAAKPVTAHIALGTSARAAQQDCENADAPPAEAGESAVRAAILCLHNQIRAERDLPLLRENPRLRRAASAHSSDMVSRGFFEHTTPDGVTMVERIMATRYASPQRRLGDRREPRLGHRQPGHAAGDHEGLDGLPRPPRQRRQAGVSRDRHRRRHRRARPTAARAPRTPRTSGSCAGSRTVGR